jgi:hypothetical protein
MFYQDLLNCLIAWFRSRKWRGILSMAFLIGALPTSAIGLVTYGANIPKGKLAASYLELIEDDLQASLDMPVEEQTEDDATIASLQVPLRRILQLGSSNERVTYLVANQVARQGRMPMAVGMMRSIAPMDDSGFAPAHAWLANYQSLTWTGDAQKIAPLLHDFKVAEQGGSLHTPQQALTYASLLARSNQTTEALRILRLYSEQFPELKLPYAQLAKQLNETEEFRLAIKAFRTQADAKVTAGQASNEDFIQLVQAAMLEENLDLALATAEQAWRSAPQDPNFRRLFSNVLLAKYQSTNRLQGPASTTNAELLDTAFNIDPNNPAVMEEVAQAMAVGRDLSPELKAALETSLADGGASSINHLIIANSQLVGGDPAAAIPHLRIALRKSPSSPVIMNNLAYAILLGAPENIEEARELVEQALRIPASSAKILASIYDTQGELRMAQQDDIGAVESLEKAIKLDNSKVNTRRRLAELYTRLGMHDAAAAQLQRIKDWTSATPATDASDAQEQQ